MGRLTDSLGTKSKAEKRNREAFFAEVNVSNETGAREGGGDICVSDKGRRYKMLGNPAIN
jgi:hypothetical protein